MRDRFEVVMKSWSHEPFYIDMKNPDFIPQLRMQALQILPSIRESVWQLAYDEMFANVDQIVHYCLTGEHQLPEKKE